MQIVDDLQMKKIGAPSFPRFILTVCMLQTEIVNAGFVQVKKCKIQGRFKDFQGQVSVN